ncbi:MAG: hypothetical protein ACKVS8_08510 [Phycisphaerales bacterium]
MNSKVDEHTDDAPSMLRLMWAAKERAAAERARRTPQEQAREEASLVHRLGLAALPSRVDEPTVWLRKPG